MTLQPLARTETLTAHALQALRAAIADGRLAPGERHSVARLADDLGVSRTPVREALLLLERQGVVAFERNLGVRILETSAQEIADIFGLRLLLEVPATRRATELLTAADLTALTRALRAMKQHAAGRDEAAFMAEDQRFHEIVLRAAGNARLLDTVGQLRDHVRFGGPSTVGRSRDMTAILAEHRAILDALKRRDADGAAAAMAEHLRTTGKLLVEQQGGDATRFDWN